jgi:hypothetical protein
MWHEWETRKVHDFGGRNMKERDNLEGQGVDGRKILKWVFKKWGGEAWIGLFWLRIGTVGELL